MIGHSIGHFIGHLIGHKNGHVTGHVTGQATWLLTSLHLFGVLGHVVRPDGAEKLDVVVTVILGHLFHDGLVRSLQRQHTVWNKQPV